MESLLGISSTVPKILFIKGIFKKDCIQVDDLFEQQLMEKVAPTHEAIQENKIECQVKCPDKLPFVFETLDTWPTTTDILCWSCHMNFNTRPLFIPRTIEPLTNSEKKYQITVYGTFCSFTCAKSYIDIFSANKADKVSNTSKLQFLYKYIYNKNMPSINEAPLPYWLMKQYGGHMTPEEYKKNILI